MDEYGIKCVINRFTGGKDKSFRRIFRRILKCLRVLSKLQRYSAQKYIRIFSFYHDGSEWTDEERAEVIKRLKEMSAYAAEKGVVLPHEN